MSTVVMSRITTQFRDLQLCDQILLHILCRVLERKTIDGATSSRALQTMAKDPVFELVEGKLLTFPLSTVSTELATFSPFFPFLHDQQPIFHVLLLFPKKNFKTHPVIPVWCNLDRYCRN